MEVSGARKWALILGIMVVLTSFLFVGINTFYKGPEWEDYKPADCPDVLGDWEECNYSSDCVEYFNEEYQNVKEPHERVEFVVLLILGILVLVGGGLIKAEALSHGFMFSGVLVLIINIMSHWMVLNDYFRFIILGVALVILIYLGYKKLNK